MERNAHSHHVHRHLHASHGYKLGSRIPHREVHPRVHLTPDVMAGPSPALEKRSWSRLIPRVDCDGADKNSSLCEKPASSIPLTVPITLAVVIPIVVALGVLLYLHRRNTKREKLEDNDDKYRSMDFGLGENKGGVKRKSVFGLGAEKDLRPHNRQISMDMNLSSPYLLPPEVQNSRESLHSLSRTLHLEADPYRHVESFTGSEVGSLRSFRKGTNDSSSTYTGKTFSSNDSRNHTLPPRTNSRTNSHPSSPLSREPPTTILDHQPRFAEPEPISPPPPSAKGDFRFVDDESAVPQVPAVSQLQERVDMPPVPEIPEPAPVAQKGAAKRLPDNPRLDSEAMMAGHGYATDRDSSALPASDLHHVAPDGLGIMDPSQSPSPAAAQRDSSRVVSDIPSEYGDYADHFQLNVQDEDADQHGQAQQRGRDQQPQGSHEHGHPLSAGLGVPRQENKRLSVGFRPLPPDDYLESEDPEFRANRIRSFYKEYFDDSKEPRPPMPQMPQAHQQAQYYEDYDSNYMGDAAFFDPDSNTFVMPYAQPVTRRAMTPPPSNRRPMPGPRPRGPHGPGGSTGGIPGGPGHRPRAGSTMSGGRGRWGPASPRPGSSASGRVGRPGQPRKPMPPPAALTTLPTPSKLRDDSFAIMGAADFAPPPTFKDQAAGRSQSPVGERRAYALNVPVASPLASAFDDIPALPSPHMLRKSATFTALDFAPPRRFKDPDAMSDAGSVRSMGSNISARNLNALRNGAGRVSRLPGDQVFTQAAMGDELKPKWGMRD